MTTATTTKKATASEELRELQPERETAHAKVQKAKKKITAWDEQTEALRVKLTTRLADHPEEFTGSTKLAREGTEAAKLTAQIKKIAQHQQNPHQAEYDRNVRPIRSSRPSRSGVQAAKDQATGWPSWSRISSRRSR